ncbi:MAG TPA: family 1 glycosylhydrolase [Candidatus Angelobacter sp.]|nr:family 1 glycosylhydrolase [Candidatus Angelobacter sp.]
MAKALRFPEGFLWGISTSAYQFEGHNYNSQWAHWEQKGGIKSRERSGRASNWWEQAERDFDLARELGVNALRLSVEWSRIEPRPGDWDLIALQRYQSMVQGLQKRGILPIVSLHHFTHPYWFEEMGGFLSDDAPRFFERFTRRILRALGGLCKHWVTFNEPNVFCTLAYLFEEFPPGKRGDIRSAAQAMVNIARSHVRAYDAIHEVQRDASVGWTTNYVVFQPARPGFLQDRFAANLQHRLFNMSFAHLVAKGTLPFPLNLFGRSKEAMGECDFVGLNVYSRAHVQFKKHLPAQLFGHIFIPDDAPQGDKGLYNPYGEAYPQGIAEAVERLHQPGKPVYILENGVPDRDDRIRPWLITTAVEELHQLIQRGYDVRGYFHWSLVDNFEWSEGWTLRFGLVSLDPETQQRTPRPSARLFSTIAHANALDPELASNYTNDPVDST